MSASATQGVHKNMEKAKKRHTSEDAVLVRVIRKEESLQWEGCVKLVCFKPGMKE